MVRRLLVVLLAGLGLPLLLPTVHADAAPPLLGGPRTAAAGCADVTIYGLRGSAQIDQTDPPMFGFQAAGVARELGDRLEADGLSVAFEGIAYSAPPAYSTDVALVGAHSGASQLMAAMRRTIQRCPESRLVPIGYSQGAAAVHFALSALERPTLGNAGVANAAAADATAAAILIADPLRRHDDGVPVLMDLGGNAPGEGLRADAATRVPASFAGRVLSVCAVGDTVCSHVSDSTDFTVHTSAYVPESARRPITGWAAQEMGA